VSLLLELNLQTSAVSFGTGLVKSALVAQLTGSSIKTEFVFPSALNAEPSVSLVNVLPVIKDMILPMVPVSFLPQTLLDLLTLAAKLGIGTIKFVLPAHNGGSLTQLLMYVSL